jgi:hypothetical protein
MSPRWGDAIVYGPGAPRPAEWAAGAGIEVCDTGVVPAAVHTCSLRIEAIAGAADSNRNCIMLWELELGSGNVTVLYEWDAIGTQMVAVPAARVRVRLRCAPINSELPFEPSLRTYRASALIAPGNSNGGGYPCQRTVHRVVAAGGSPTNITIPSGARAFRVIGVGDPAVAGSPFTADFRVVILGSPDEYFGDDLLPGHGDGSWIPLPYHRATVMRLTNSSASNMSIGVVFQLDV